MPEPNDRIDHQPGIEEPELMHISVRATYTPPGNPRGILEEEDVREGTDLGDGLKKFRDDFLQLLQSEGKGLDTDLMFLNLSAGNPDAIEEVDGSLLDSRLGDEPNFWYGMFRSAREGALLMRKPGEPYPRRLEFRNSELSLTKEMIGGITVTGNPPPKPGFFSNLLYDLFEIETSSMRRYLRYQDLLDRQAAIGTQLDGLAENLREGGFLEVERMKPDERDKALYEKYIETGYHQRTIVQIRNRKLGLNCLVGNLTSQGAMHQVEAPNVGELSIDPQLRAYTGFLLSAVDPDQPTTVRESFTTLLAAFGQEKLPDGGVDMTDFHNGLDQVDFGVKFMDTSPQTVADYIAGALRNTATMCRTLQSKGLGGGETFCQLTQLSDKILEILDQPENAQLKERVTQTLGVQNMHYLRGCGELAWVHMKGLDSQSQLLSLASQPSAQMSNVEKKQLMLDILVGNQAQLALQDKKGAQTLQRLGKEAEQGQNFAQRVAADYVQSARLEEYSGFTVEALGRFFGKQESIIKINNAILTEKKNIASEENDALQFGRSSVQSSRASNASMEQKPPKAPMINGF